MLARGELGLNMFDGASTVYRCLPVQTMQKRLLYTLEPKQHLLNLTINVYRHLGIGILLAFQHFNMEELFLMRVYTPI